MPFRKHGFLIPFDMKQRLAVRCICHRCDHPAAPVEIIGRYISGRVRQIFRCCVHICIKWHHDIKCIWGKCHPLDHTVVLCSIWSHLDRRHEISPVNADGTICTCHLLISIWKIWVVWCSLIMRGQHIFDILHRHLMLRNQTPRNVVRYRCVICIFTIPAVGLRIQVPLHKPCSWRIVDMIRIIMAAKYLSWINESAKRQIRIFGLTFCASSNSQIQMILLDKFRQIFWAHMCVLIR